MDVNYIIQKSRRRSISIQVSDDKKIFVKVPFGTSLSAAQKFVTEKKEWIIKQPEKVEKQIALADSMGPLTDKDIKQIKKRAKVIIPERVEYFSRLSGIAYNRISIRLQKSRWASCSVDGNLNFNCLLVLMPMEVLDSVVVHELCHRRHMNHSKEFYDEVIEIYPDYIKWNKWLKLNGGAYFKRILK